MVDQLESKFRCAVEYPQEIRNRKTQTFKFRSLHRSLKKVFTKESFSIVRKGKKTVVEVYNENNNPLGNLANRKVQAKTINSKKGSVKVDSTTLLVSFNRDMSASRKEQLLRQYNLSYDKQALKRSYFMVGLNKGQEVTETRAKLRKSGHFKVDYNHIVKAASGNIGLRVEGTQGVTIGGSTGVGPGGETGISTGGTDSDFPDDPTWGYRAVNANTTEGGEIVYRPKVVILDTGLTQSHNDLPSKNLSSEDLSGATNDDNDDNGHGTGVMGIMAGAESGVEGKDKVDHVAIKVF